MKCKDCTDIECKRRGDPNMKCFYEEDSQEELEENYNWQSFRNQAAKDILCSVILTFEAKESFDKALDNAIDNSIKAADKLISKLKEKEGE